jgi:release factor glutamine methyltransferase
LAKYLFSDIFESLEVSSDEDINTIMEAVKDLNNHKPLQYITGKAYFMDFTLKVNDHVLIPRPETEEVVEAALCFLKQNSHITHVYDLCTGSGCIAIAIKRARPNVMVVAVDISDGAISVAKQNAALYNLDIDFKIADVLSDLINIHDHSLIISNPPYISEEEKQEMKANVLNFEPHIALFAGQDPLVFYKRIASIGVQTQSAVICEINEFLGAETRTVFEQIGYKDVLLKKDMQGKVRMLSTFDF